MNAAHPIDRMVPNLGLWQDLSVPYVLANGQQKLGAELGREVGVTLRSVDVEAANGRERIRQPECDTWNGDDGQLEVSARVT